MFWKLPDISSIALHDVDAYFSLQPSWSRKNMVDMEGTDSGYYRDLSEIIFYLL